MKDKMKIVVPVLLVVLGVAYKMVLAKPEPVNAKVHGKVYVLPKEFVVNLADGRFAKITAGLLVSEKQALGGGEGATKPPEGFGTLEQEPLVRQIITDHLTEAKADDL